MYQTMGYQKCDAFISNASLVDVLSSERSFGATKTARWDHRCRGSSTHWSPRSIVNRGVLTVHRAFFPRRLAQYLPFLLRFPIVLCSKRGSTRIPLILHSHCRKGAQLWWTNCGVHRGTAAELTASPPSSSRSPPALAPTAPAGCARRRWPRPTSGSPPRGWWSRSRPAPRRWWPIGCGGRRRRRAACRRRRWQRPVRRAPWTVGAECA